MAKLDEVRSNPFDVEVSEEDMCEDDITELIIDNDDADEVILDNSDLKQTELAVSSQLSIRNDSRVNSVSPWHQSILTEFRFSCWPAPLGRHISLL